jgi:hypothetical protein
VRPSLASFFVDLLGTGRVSFIATDQQKPRALPAIAMEYFRGSAVQPSLFFLRLCAPCSPVSLLAVRVAGSALGIATREATGITCRTALGLVFAVYPAELGAFKVVACASRARGALRLRRTLCILVSLRSKRLLRGSRGDPVGTFDAGQRNGRVRLDRRPCRLRRCSVTVDHRSATVRSKRIVLSRANSWNVDAGLLISTLTCS